MDVIYRLCEAEVKKPWKPIRPNWFDKRKCLKSFLKALEYSKDVVSSVTFLHDGPKGELYNLIPNNYNIVSVDYCSNEKSLLKTFDIADELSGDNIYFMEDDYLHLEDSIIKAKIAVEKLGLVTLYDHLDRYIRNDDITKGNEYIAFIAETNLHWRTCESTCCSWVSTRELWNEIKDDCRKFALRDRDLFRNFYNKGLRLWSPIPGLTTQIDDKLSPGIDWEAFNADN